MPTLRLNLAPLQGGNSRRKYNIAFPDMDTWRAMVGLPSTDVLPPKKIDFSQEKPFSKFELLNKINHDVEDLVPAEDDDAVDDIYKCYSDDYDSSDYELDLSLSKELEYLGHPLRTRREQEQQLKAFRQHYTELWAKYDLAPGVKKPSPLDVDRDRTGPDDHIPMSQLTLVERDEAQRHRDKALEILQGKRQSLPTPYTSVKYQARFEFFAREHDAYRRALQNVDVEEGEAIPDSSFMWVYKDMRQFYVIEHDGLLERHRKDAAKEEAAKKATIEAAAAELNQLRGYACLSKQIGRAFGDEEDYLQQKEDLIRVPKKGRESWLLLIDKQYPGVLESCIIIDDYTPRQMLHIYQTIEDRGFRDLIWVVNGSDSWPKDITDDESVKTLLCPSTVPK